MLSSKGNFFTSSESEKIMNLLKNPKEDFQKIVSLVEEKIKNKVTVESNKSLREAQTIAHIGHFNLNAETLEVTGSDELFNIFGLTREEATLDAFAGVVHPDDREYDLYHIRRGLETGESWDIEHRLILRDGNEKWVHAIGEATRDESGKVSMVLGTVQDITIRKNIEKSLEKERNFTETAINSQRDTFFIFDPSEGKAIRWNRAFQKASGYSDEEISTMNAPESYYDENDLKKAASSIEKIRIEGSALIEMNLINKDGKKIPFEYIGSNISDDEGNPKFIVAIGRNISKRKESERILKQSEENLNRAQTLAQLGHWELDPVTMEVSGSKELFKIFGLTNQEATLDAFGGVVHPDDRGYDLYHIQRGIETGESWDIEHRLITKDGIEKWVHAIGETNKDDNGKVILVLGTIQDITERKNLEEILYQERDLIRTLLENHPDFIYFKDKNARFRHLSTRFGDFLGHTIDDIVGKTDLELFPEEVAKQTYSEDLNVIQTGTPLINKEEGTGETWVLTTKIPWFDKEGNIKGLFGISRDITERKNAEQKLRESEEKYRGLVNNITDIIYELNIKGKCTYVSSQLFEISGFYPEEMIGQNVFNFLHQDDIMSVAEKVKEAFNDRTRISTEFNLKHKDGHYVPVSSNFSATQIKDDLKIIGVLRDITEKRKAELKLKESEEELRSLNNELETILAVIPGILFCKDRNDVVTRVNQNFANSLNLKKEDLIGKSSLDLFPRDQVEKFRKDDLEIYESGKPKLNIEESAEFPDGNIWALTNKTPYYNEKGEIIGIIGLSIDITDRKKIEQKLKDSEKKYRLLFDKSPIGINLFTIDRKLIDSNSAMEKITGYSIEEFKNLEAISMYADPNDREKLKKLLQEFGKVRDYETKFKKKNNTEYFGSINLDLIELDGVKTVQSTLRDITDQKKAEILVKNEMKRLKEIDKMKSEFLRRTSHELKTPLVSILGFTNLLLEFHSEKLDYDIASNLNEIKQGCKRLESLIADILKTAELESSAIKPRKKEEDLSFLIKLCVNEQRGSAKLRNHNLDLKIQDNLIALIEKEQIHQVISNLLSNAIKYTPPNGIIEINSEIKNNYLVVSIKDNGIGFSTEEKSGLFRQFGKIERFGKGWDIDGEGSGLGLYISKKIMEMHDGDIWVESEGRNKGSTFYFSLPLNNN